MHHKKGAGQKLTHYKTIYNDWAVIFFLFSPPSPHLLSSQLLVQAWWGIGRANIFQSGHYINCETGAGREVTYLWSHSEWYLMTPKNHYHSQSMICLSIGPPARLSLVYFRLCFWRARGCVGLCLCVWFWQEVKWQIDRIVAVACYVMLCYSMFVKLMSCLLVC